MIRTITAACSAVALTSTLSTGMSAAQTEDAPIAVPITFVSEEDANQALGASTTPLTDAFKSADLRPYVLAARQDLKDKTLSFALTGDDLATTTLGEADYRYLDQNKKPYVQPGTVTSWIGLAVLGTTNMVGGYPQVDPKTGVIYFNTTLAPAGSYRIVPVDVYAADAPETDGGTDGEAGGATATPEKVATVSVPLVVGDPVADAELGYPAPAGVNVCAPVEGEEETGLLAGGEGKPVEYSEGVWSCFAAPVSQEDLDEDKDGLLLGEELNLGTDPTKADTDGDGLTDKEEIDGSKNTAFGNQPTDPTKADSDGDEWSDGQEVTADPATNPNNAASHPAGDPDIAGGSSGLMGDSELSSGLPEQCLSAALGWGIPLLVLLPVAALASAGIQALKPITDPIGEALGRVNAQIQQQLGVFNPQLAAQFADTRQMTGLAATLAGVVLLAGAAATIVTQCIPEETKAELSGDQPAANTQQGTDSQQGSSTQQGTDSQQGSSTQQDA